MKTKRIWIAGATAMALVFGMAATPAYAGKPHVSNVLKGVGHLNGHVLKNIGHVDGKILKGIGHAAPRDFGRVLNYAVRDAGRGNGQVLNGVAGALRHSGVNGRDVGRTLGALERGAAYGGRNGINNLGGVLNGVLPYGGYGRGGWEGRGDHYRDPYAEAYRDAAVANAVASVVGSVAIAATQPGYIAAPAPVQYYSAPRVVVYPSHYESIQVWVPEVYDPYTGQRTGGYYETQRRYVPEVCEEAR